MTEFFTQLSDLIQNNLGQVILILSTPIVGSVTLGMLIGFFTKLIGNHTAKKYTKPMADKYEELKNTLAGIPNQVQTMLKEFNENNIAQVRLTYAELQAEYEKTKREICKDIANEDDALLPKVEEIQTKVIEFKNAEVSNLSKTESNSNENEKVEEFVEESKEIENTGNSVENSSDEEELL